MTDSVRSRRGERGLALILIALVLVVLLVFAAFAVDLGGLYSARRNDQNSADVGALAGAAELIDGGTDTQVIDQVRARVHNTLGVSFTATQWNSCTAAGLTFPAGYAAMTHSTDGLQDCIRKESASNRVYVRVPERELESVFGGVVGIAGFDHTAFAIAGMGRVGFGNVLPFGLVGGGSYACLKDAPGGLSIPPCDGPDTGNFSYLDFTYFGGDIGTTETCNGQTNERLSNNIAAGIDHDLSKYTGTEVIEGVECGATENDPNTMNTETGNKQSAFGDGIYSGSDFSDGDDARLQRTHSSLFAGSGVTEVVGGHTLDDNPLWAFIPDSFPAGADDVPDSCHKDVFDDVLANDYSGLPSTPADVQDFITSQAADPANPTDAEKATQMRWMLVRCFQHYTGDDFDGGGSILPSGEASDCPNTGCTDPVFSRDTVIIDEVVDIQLTPRFGYVPQLDVDEFPSGSDEVHVETFHAIFLHRLLGGCSGNSCDIDFEPMGSGIDPSANDPSLDTANAITAFVFPSTMLPNGLAGDDAPFELGVNRFVRLLR